MSSTFAENLMVTRKRLAVTQQGLADALGTNVSQVSRWENGFAVPSMENLVKICRALKCSADELLGLKPILETA